MVSGRRKKRENKEKVVIDINKLKQQLQEVKYRYTRLESYGRFVNSMTDTYHPARLFIGLIDVEKEFVLARRRRPRWNIRSMPWIAEYVADTEEMLPISQLITIKKYLSRKYCLKNLTQKQRSFFDHYFFKIRIRDHKIFDPYWNTMFLDDSFSETLLNLHSNINYTFDSFFELENWFFQYFFFLLKDYTYSDYYKRLTFFKFEYVRYFNLLYEPILYFNLNLILKYYYKITDFSYFLIDFKGFCCMEMGIYTSTEILIPSFFYYDNNEMFTLIKERDKYIYIFPFMKFISDYNALIVLRNDVEYANKVVYTSYVGTKYFYLPSFRRILVKKYSYKYMKFDGVNRVDLGAMYAGLKCLYYNNVYIIDLFTNFLNYELITTSLGSIFLSDSSIKSLSVASVIFDSMRQKATLVSLIRFDVMFKLWSFLQDFPKKFSIALLKYYDIYQLPRLLQKSITYSELFYLSIINLWDAFFFPFFFWKDIINNVNFMKIFYLNFNLKNTTKWPYLFVFAQRIIHWNILFFREKLLTKWIFELRSNKRYFYKMLTKLKKTIKREDTVNNRIRRGKGRKKNKKQKEIEIEREKNLIINRFFRYSVWKKYIYNPPVIHKYVLKYLAELGPWFESRKQFMLNSYNLSRKIIKIYNFTDIFFPFSTYESYSNRCKKDLLINTFTFVIHQSFFYFSKQRNKKKIESYGKKYLDFIIKLNEKRKKNNIYILNKSLSLKNLNSKLNFLNNILNLDFFNYLKKKFINNFFLKKYENWQKRIETLIFFYINIYIYFQKKIIKNFFEIYNLYIFNISPKIDNIIKINPFIIFWDDNILEFTSDIRNKVDVLKQRDNRILYNYIFRKMVVNSTLYFKITTFTYFNISKFDWSMIITDLAWRTERRLPKDSCTLTGYMEPILSNNFPLIFHEKIWDPQPIETDRYSFFWSYEIISGWKIWSMDHVYNFFYYNIELTDQFDAILLDGILIENYRDTTNILNYFFKTINHKTRKNIPFTMLYLDYITDFCTKIYLNNTYFHLFYNLLIYKMNNFSENSNNIVLHKEIDYHYIKYFSSYVYFYEFCSLLVDIPNCSAFSKEFKNRVEDSYHHKTNRELIYWHHEKKAKEILLFWHREKIREKEEMRALFALLFPESVEKKKTWFRYR